MITQYVLKIKKLGILDYTTINLCSLKNFSSKIHSLYAKVASEKQYYERNNYC